MKDKTKLHIQNIGFYLLLALLVAIVSRNFRFAGDTRIVQAPDITLHDFIYFLGEDITRFLLMVSLLISTKLIIRIAPQEEHTATGLKIIVNAMLLLSVGKVFDEFNLAQGYSVWEMIFDLFVVILTIYKFFKWSNTNRNPQT